VRVNVECYFHRNKNTQEKPVSTDDMKPQELHPGLPPNKLSVHLSRGHIFQTFYDMEQKVL
jgi:hypothetical protein